VVVVFVCCGVVAVEEMGVMVGWLLAAVVVRDWVGGVWFVVGLVDWLDGVWFVVWMVGWVCR